MTQQLLLNLWASLTVIELVILLMDVIILSLFTLLIKRVFSPENRERYRRESQIPLDDDTEDEKQRFHPVIKASKRHHFDA